MTVEMNMRDTTTRTESLNLFDSIVGWGFTEFRAAIPGRLAARDTGMGLTNSPSGSMYNPEELFLDRPRDWRQIAHTVVQSDSALTGDKDNAEYRRRLVETLFTSWLSDAEKHEEIIAVLRLLGLDKAANRLSYLQRAVEDDLDEIPIELKSLRQLTWFLIAERQLPHPRIAVSPDGLMQVEWHTEDSGIVAMKFLLDGKIQFAGISGRIGEGIKGERVSGTLQKDDMMGALRPFISRLGSG